MVLRLIIYTSQFCEFSHGTKALQEFRKLISQERRIFISQERLIWFPRKWLLRTFAKNCKICSQVTSQSQIINRPTLKVSNPDSVGMKLLINKVIFLSFFQKVHNLGIFHGQIDPTAKQGSRTAVNKDQKPRFGHG